jgi:acyl-CoA synthetase (AMP-forming)/AMP-acid ligase II
LGPLNNKEIIHSLASSPSLILGRGGYNNVLISGAISALGDVGHVDEDGYFYIVDRVKELIKYKGFQVVQMIEK